MPSSKRFRSGSFRSSPSVEPLEGRRLLSANVLHWQDDNAQDGLNPNETTLTTSNVNSKSFGKLFSYPVDGQIYAQPLYVSNLAIAGKGTFNVVFVATENNSIYAFNADSNSGSTGGLLWHVNLGPAAATPNKYFGARYGPYMDIYPKVGVTSTPVIDLANGTMFVDAFTNDAVGVYSHHIYALNLTTGQNQVAPVKVSATYAGNSVTSVNGKLVFNATNQLQRPALTLFNGALYVAYGSYSDTDPYHGWVLSFNEKTLAPLNVFNTTPNLLSPKGSNPGEGAIWQAGGGIASDGTNLYLETSNGDFNPAIGDYGDSALKLSPTLNVLDSFTPKEQATLAADDLDYGSAAPLILPDSVGSAAHPHLMLNIGKEGIIYLLDRDHLGGYSTTSDQVVQKVSIGHDGFGSFAYFNGNLYVHGLNDELKQFKIANGHITAGPFAHSSKNFAFPASTPTVSSNGTNNGIVWETEYSSSSAVLHAYNAANVGQELYNSAQAGSRDALPAGVKFSIPTIANGKVFVGTSNSLAVFGIMLPPPPPSTMPTLTAKAGNKQVALTWTPVSGASGYWVRRASAVSGPYNTIASDVMGLSFTDTTVTNGDTYWYVVTPIFGSKYGQSSYHVSATPMA